MSDQGTLEMRIEAAAEALHRAFLTDFGRKPDCRPFEASANPGHWRDLASVAIAAADTIHMPGADDVPGELTYVPDPQFGEMI